MLPDWLQQIAADCTEQERQSLEDTLKKPYDQVAADRRYRKAQKAKGVVRKTVLVPESRVKELQALCRQWREAV